MITTQLKIQGMTCSHCSNSVSNIIREVHGVTNVQVDLKTGIATFETENETTKTAVINTINQTGVYTASL